MEQVFISAEDYENSDRENQFSTLDMHERLIRLFGAKNVTLGYGSFEGEIERTFRVKTNKVSYLLNLARTFNQDCILVVDDEKNALLYGTNFETPVRVGTFEKVESIADYHSWTHMPDGFYVAQ